MNYKPIKLSTDLISFVNHIELNVYEQGLHFIDLMDLFPYLKSGIALRQTVNYIIYIYYIIGTNINLDQIVYFLNLKPELKEINKMLACNCVQEYHYDPKYLYSEFNKASQIYEVLKYSSEHSFIDIFKEVNFKFTN